MYMADYYQSAAVYMIDGAFTQRSSIPVVSLPWKWAWVQAATG